MGLGLLGLLFGVPALVWVSDGVGRGRSGLAREPHAFRALVAIGSAQHTFRERGLAGSHRFGTLEELVSSGVLDTRVIAAAEEHHELSAVPGARTPDFLWFATANPRELSGDNDRYYVINHHGVIFFTTDGPIEIDRERCEMPATTLPTSSGYRPRREPEKY